MCDPDVPLLSPPASKSVWDTGVLRITQLFSQVGPLVLSHNSGCSKLSETKDFGLVKNQDKRGINRSESVLTPLA